jgi:hypothetical protein
MLHSRENRARNRVLAPSYKRRGPQAVQTKNGEFDHRTGAFGFLQVYDSIRKPAYKAILVGICAAFLLLCTIRFAYFYYTYRYANGLRETLYPELPSALNQVQQLAGSSMPIYITNRS